MPIRAENRKRYPGEWPAISLRIRRDRAAWRCEHTDQHGERCLAVHGQPHPITGSKVVLTVAHLDHTPEHCDESNLRAMCQRCHNTYDAPTRRAGTQQRARATLAIAELDLGNGNA
ncbi:hypothetical protein EOD42_09060 [Rhodovarius crocodyli]|uniref:HNH endonuclease n=1 Tax=Rhodovarius crocodyli TaxID=1979269 RepID=A0A437MJT1_9PROT|nr:hypothetical protein [Rhodovarius crocodyli]RVT97927.1 hypothetical protein EOD42_09060 [Rhodovarius crocodyli]